MLAYPPPHNSKKGGKGAMYFKTEFQFEKKRFFFELRVYCVVAEAPAPSLFFRLAKTQTRNWRELAL